MIYANENDAKTVAWLEQLPLGLTVDSRSIEEVQSEDVTRYTRCHWFAGIGGWELALRYAGWPTDEPVWTGSCPCQPISCAGRQRGAEDERHLWPEWYRLISECRPSTIFGEQVGGKLGRQWLDGVSLDLEELGYAVAAADLPAACVGAPVISQRLFWLATSNSDGWRGRRVIEEVPSRTSRAAPCGTCEGYPGWNASIWVADAFGDERRFPLGYERMADGLLGGVHTLRGLGNSIVPQVAAEFIRAYMES